MTVTASNGLFWRALDDLPPSEWVSSWLSWWLGDTAGLLIVARRRCSLPFGRTGIGRSSEPRHWLLLTAALSTFRRSWTSIHWTGAPPQSLLIFHRSCC